MMYVTKYGQKVLSNINAFGDAQLINHRVYDINIYVLHRILQMCTHGGIVILITRLIM